MLTIIAILIITLIASCVGTMTGFGLSTIMLPTLLLFLPLTQVILLVSIIHWFLSGWNTILFRKGINWQLFAYFGIPAMLTSIVGARLVGEESEHLLPYLGIFFIGYSFLLIFVPKFQLPHNRSISLLGGSLSGFFAGIFGMRGAIRSVFLSAFNLPKIVYLGSTALIGFCVDSTRLIVYGLEGINLYQSLWWGLLLFIPASFVGSYIGRHLVYKIPTEYFRPVVALFLLIVGLRLLFF